MPFVNISILKGKFVSIKIELFLTTKHKSKESVIVLNHNQRQTGSQSLLLHENCEKFGMANVAGNLQENRILAFRHM